jgi:hypothetical protein
MITTEQTDVIHAKMMEMFGERMAHPDHEPLQFEYQVRMAIYSLGWKIEKKP